MTPAQVEELLAVLWFLAACQSTGVFRWFAGGMALVALVTVGLHFEGWFQI